MRTGKPLVHIWPKDGAPLEQRITVSIDDYLNALAPAEAIDLVLRMVANEDITKDEAIYLLEKSR